MRGPGPARPGVVLAAAVLAAALVTANVSVLNVALPVLLPALDATQTQGQWMVDVYAVVLAALLLPIGAIGDRYGRRLILLIGLVVLALANGVTALLDDPLHVIIARGVAGLGAAFIFPATLSTITATMPDNLRSRGIALWTASISVGGFIGILVSGVLIENYRWEVLFLAMGATSAVVLVVCAVTVPDSSDPAHAHLDPVGSLLSAIGVGALVLGIIEGPVKGWTEPLTLGGLILGGVALIGFVAWELRTPTPVLDVRLFANRGVRAGSISVFTQFLGAFGVFFLVVFHLGLVLGYGPLDTGLALIPISIGLIPASIVAIPLADRLGRGPVGATGLSIMAIAFVYGTTITVDDGIAEFLVCMITMGVGFGLAGPPATDAIVESLPPAKQGVASALNDVLRELGAAIGIAVAGSAFNSGYRSAVSSFTGYPQEVVEALRASPFALPELTPTLEPELAGALVADVQQASIDGWGQGLTALAVGLAIGALAVFVWAPRRSARADREAGRHALGPPGTVPDVGHQIPAPVAVADAAPAPAPVAIAEPAAPPPLPAAAAGPGPLGAMELAAAAEGQLGGVLRGLADVERDVDLLDRRTAVPEDMATWSASEQVEVAERAAVGLEEPLTTLIGRIEALHRDLAAAGLAVDDARAELVRLGRDPRQYLPEVERRIAEIRVRAARTDQRFAQLLQRFAQMAALFSTLRPAAASMDDGRRRMAAVAAEVGVLTGVRARDDRPETVVTGRSPGPARH